MKTEALIDDLARDLTAVRPVRPQGMLSMAAVAFSFSVLGAAFFLFPLRDDFFVRLLNPFYLFSLIGVVFVLFFSAFLLDQISVPGRSSNSKAIIGITVVAAIVIIEQVTIMFFQPTESLTTGIGLNGVNCALTAMLVSLAPFVALFFMIRKRALTDLKKGPVLLGVASICVGIMAIQLHCAVDNASHVVLWHLAVPAIFALAFAVLIVKPLIRW